MPQAPLIDAALAARSMAYAPYSRFTVGAALRTPDGAIHSGGDAPCTPCGGCRQKLREFGGPELVIRIVDAAGQTLLHTSLAELLPHSFGPDNLAR